MTYLSVRCAGMLQWFVGSLTANDAQHNGYVIETNDIVCTSRNLASGALNSLAPMRMLRNFFSREAWDVVKDTGLSYINLL